MGDQQRRVDANHDARRRHIGRVLDRRERGYQTRTPERYARRHGHLAEEVEPAGHPREEGREMRGRQHRGPEIGASRRWVRGGDLCHAQADEHGEEGDDEPADCHHGRAAGVQPIGEEGRYAGYDGDDAEGGQYLSSAVLGQEVGEGAHTRRRRQSCG